MPGIMNYIVERLRSDKAKDTVRPPMPTKTRGYQLYVKEAELNGETPKSYDEWIKTQPVRFE